MVFCSSIKIPVWLYGPIKTLLAGRIRTGLIWVPCPDEWPIPRGPFAIVVPATPPPANCVRVYLAISLRRTRGTRSSSGRYPASRLLAGRIRTGIPGWRSAFGLGIWRAGHPLHPPQRQEHRQGQKQGDGYPFVHSSSTTGTSGKIRFATCRTKIASCSSSLPARSCSRTNRDSIFSPLKSSGRPQLQAHGDSPPPA